MMFFGAASSAHQVEGDNVQSDWWRFEQEVLQKNGVFSGKATDHFHRYREDFELAKQLGHNAHRFSLEWAKIEPKEGQFDEAIIEHYRNIFAELKKLELQPFVTLWHFTLPQWFAEKGGFLKKKNIRYFLRYCEYITEQLGADFEYVLTINEPEVYSYYSYLLGKWPPLQKGFLNYFRVMKNLAFAHQKAYAVVKSRVPNALVSFAKDNQVFSPVRSKNLFDRGITFLLDYLWNHSFLDRVKHQIDFIGLNYYFHRCVKAELGLVKDFCNFPLPTRLRSDLNWEVDPEGIYHMVKDLFQRYKKPILITENGIADAKDAVRSDFITDSLRWLFKAQKEGVELMGYLHWALTDNFEWLDGFKARFGLIAIDYKTQKRTVRKSALVYKKLIEKYLHDFKLH